MRKQQNQLLTMKQTQSGQNLMQSVAAVKHQSNSLQIRQQMPATNPATGSHSTIEAMSNKPNARNQNSLQQTKQSPYFVGGSFHSTVKPEPKYCQNNPNVLFR